MLQVANEAILGQDNASEFCTAALAFLRPSDDGYSLTVACAGHAPPFVLRADGGGAVEEAGICGTLLGVDVRAQFHDYTTHLGVGDLLAFWTDGVTERRHAGELFGEQRLATLIEQLEGRPADEHRPAHRRGRRRVRPRASPTTTSRSSRRASRRLRAKRGAGAVEIPAGTGEPPAY